MAALASLERFGEEYPDFLNWRSCRHCLQNEWSLVFIHVSCEKGWRSIKSGHCFSLIVWFKRFFRPNVGFKKEKIVNFQEIFHPTRLIWFIWASRFIDFQEHFQPSCFFTWTNEKFSALPAVRAYLIIRFEEKFEPTILLEPPLVLET